jgi:prepilin-type N-terminal cleavage/methylation domain-containing protein
MKRFFNFSGGFTLIELLIVITIMGIISTIILRSISSSRAKAYDSKVEQQLRGFRTAAEIYFTNQTPNSYGVNNSCSTGIFVDFNPVDGSPGSYIKSANLPTGTEIDCYSNESAYAVEATLYASGSYWCVDSKGASRAETLPLPANQTFCN